MSASEMSKSKILDAVLYLIQTLDEAGILSVFDITDRLGIRSVETVVIRRGQRLNYDMLVPHLMRGRYIFIEGASRQRAWYITKSLRRRYGLSVRYEPAVFENMMGYAIIPEGEQNEEEEGGYQDSGQHKDGVQDAQG